MSESDVRVALTPSGPPVPPAGWRCVMAEGFHPDFPLGAAASRFAPNRHNNAGDGGRADCEAFNPNEVQVFSAAQVALTSAGVQLEAVPSSGRPGAPAHARYVSACLSSQPVYPVAGQSGFPITGFGFLPTAGALTCLEIVVTLPTDASGADMGWWAQGDGTGINEIDLCEWTNYVADHPGQTATIAAWIDHGGGASSGNQAFNLPAQTDGLPHRWTSLFDGQRRRVTTYLDGAEIPELAYPWPDPFPPKPANLLLSFALRDAYPGQGPSFTDRRTVTVRSVACYQDAAHADAGITGGGIAAGTRLV